MAQGLDDRREKLGLSHFERELRIAGDDAAELTQETAELVRIAVPHVPEQRRGDVICGITNSLIQPATKVVDRLRTCCRPRCQADGLFEILDVGADRHAARVANLLARGVRTEGTVLHHALFKDGMGLGKRPFGGVGLRWRTLFAQRVEGLAGWR